MIPPGPIRRVVVMGPPGSGKSSLARTIGDQLDLPVVHFDQLHRGPGWVERPAAEFHAAIDSAVGENEWVIDGNHFGRSRDRLERAELIVLLDLPRRITLPRLIRRIVGNYGRVRPDSAPGCPERLDLGFLYYCWRWPATKYRRWMVLVGPYAAKTVHLRSTAAVAQFTATLRSGQRVE